MDQIEMTDAETVAQAFRFLRAVNRKDNESFVAELENEISPRTISTLCHIALAAGSTVAHGSIDAWLTAGENELTTKANQNGTEL